MKTAELTGALLDYWVAKALDMPAEVHSGICFLAAPASAVSCIPGTNVITKHWYPSTNWAQGGPIVEREKLRLCEPDPKAMYVDSSLDGQWRAMKANQDTRMYEHEQFGATPLIAAMRVYVASKFGEDVEVPV